MIGGARRREGDEFAQGEKRDEGEHRNGGVLAQREGGGENRHHPPPGANARHEIVDDGARPDARHDQGERGEPS